MKSDSILFVIITLLLTAPVFAAATPDGILGIWSTEGGDSRLELFKCGTAVCGKIVWLKEPRYIDSIDGPLGVTKIDRKNPARSLRNRPILGLSVMQGLSAKGDRRWENGTCYNPETGKSYKCKMYLKSKNLLEVRGFIGFSLFGRTLVLKRF